MRRGADRSASQRKEVVECEESHKKMVGGLVAINFIFPEILGV